VRPARLHQWQHLSNGRWAGYSSCPQAVAWQLPTVRPSGDPPVNSAKSNTGTWPGLQSWSQLRMGISVGWALAQSGIGQWCARCAVLGWSARVECWCLGSGWLLCLLERMFERKTDRLFPQIPV
jgi:hypothetical protein